MVSGVAFPGLVGTYISHAGIYTTAGATVAEVATDINMESASSVVRFAAVTLSAGVSYDVVLKVAASMTIAPAYTMGEAEADVPTDVKACLPSYMKGAVTGTIGSLTPDTSWVRNIGVIVDDYPASGGGGLMRNPSLSGGMI